MSRHLERTQDAGPSYPIETPDDPRFTDRLLADVGHALAANGYPPLTGEDVLDLGKAMHEFLYEKEFAGRQWRVRAPRTPDVGNDLEGVP